MDVYGSINNVSETFGVHQLTHMFWQGSNTKFTASARNKIPWLERQKMGFLPQWTLLVILSESISTSRKTVQYLCK